MKTRLILAVSSLLIGCASPKVPEFPGIKDHYVVEVREGSAHCLRFEVTSKIPYKIKFVQQELLEECNMVGGYRPKDSQALYNWIDDTKIVVERFKHCLSQ